MNLQKYTKAAKIFAVTVALLCSGSLAYAETVVHTTRHYRDSLNAAKNAADDAPLAEINIKSKHNAEADNSPKTIRRPRPYSWEQAVGYAEMYPEDITPHKIGGYKDIYGNFSKVRVLDFLGKSGLSNSGMSFWGHPDHTFIRVTLQYGSATDSWKPFAMISWGADVKVLPSGLLNKSKKFISDYSPKSLKIIFESGYQKEFLIDADRVIPTTYINWGFLLIKRAYYQSGRIDLTNEDIWDIYKHGNIANILLDFDYLGAIPFFYSGEKQEEHKKQLTYGFEHMVRLLNITPGTLAYERKQREDAERKEYRDKLREEVKKEIYKDEIRKEIMEEVRKEYREDKQMIAEWGGK